VADLGYISWFEPFREPTWLRPTLPPGEQLAFARGFYPLPAPFMDSWFEALSEPRRYPPILIPGQQRFDFRPIAAPPISPPGVPIGLYGVASTTSITANWFPGAGDAWTSFTLQWRLVGASTWNTVTGITALTYVITGLTPITAYQIQVQAVNSAGGSGYVLGGHNTSLNPSDLTHCTLSSGNLTATHDGTGSFGGVRALDGQSTGKFYFEWQINSLSIGSGGSTTGVGLATCAYTLGQSPAISYQPLIALSCPANNYLGSGHWHMSVWANGANPIFNISGFDTTVQPFGIAVDVDAQMIWVYCASDGYWNASATANPATGTGGISFSDMGAVLVVPVVNLNGATSDSITVNFGATAFTNSVPSGFIPGWPSGYGTCANPNPTPPVADTITVTTLPPPSPVVTPTLGSWRGVCGINWMGLALVGDGLTNVLGRSDFAAFTEYGNPMRLLVTSPPIQGNRYRMFIRKFEVEVQAGVGETAAPNPQMMLEYSRDAGETFGPLIIWRSMGVTGDYTARLRWLSLGSSREWVLRLTCTDPVRRAIIGTYLDAKEGTG
jgi:Fibronectin type III domain